MGILLVAATPIGNLSDVSVRLLKAINECNIVACEDTRMFKRICAAHQTTVPRLISYHEHNERERISMLLEELKNGATVLLASNAGTPLISDPGYAIVRAAIEAGFTVSPIPGPSAAISALCCSGLRVDRFAFLGFPPRKPGKLVNFLKEASRFDGTLIMYESPNRVAKLISAACQVFGDAPAVLARELTKVHEEFLRGGLCELSRTVELREPIGECCLLIENRVKDEGKEERKARKAAWGVNEKSDDTDEYNDSIV